MQMPALAPLSCFEVVLFMRHEIHPVAAAVVVVPLHRRRRRCQRAHCHQICVGGDGDPFPPIMANRAV